MSQKLKGRIFEHPLWREAITCLDDKEAEVLVVRLRAGDPEASQLLVKGYMRLALSVVSKYLAIYKGRRWVDDFVSAAMAGVVLAVSDIKSDVTIISIKGRIVSRIHYELGDYLKSVNANQIKFEGAMLLDHDRLLLEARDNENLARIEAIIEDSVENELEAQIVKMRRDGYTDDEIADVLGVSRSTVQVIRQELHDRVKDLLPGRKCNVRQTEEID